MPNERPLRKLAPLVGISSPELHLKRLLLDYLSAQVIRCNYQPLELAVCIYFPHGTNMTALSDASLPGMSILGTDDVPIPCAALKVRLWPNADPPELQLIFVPDAAYDLNLLPQIEGEQSPEEGVLSQVRLVQFDFPRERIVVANHGYDPHSLPLRAAS